MNSFALHLLRHGAPTTPGLMLGHTDMAPTPEGIDLCRLQVRALAVEQLIASHLQRSCTAAQAIGIDHDLTPALDPRWRELDFGDWDGHAPADIDPAALGRFWSDPDASPPPGGEPWSGLTARVAAALAELTPRPTLVVTHGGPMRAVLHLLCGFDIAQLWSFDLPYGSLLSLRVWPGPKTVAQITGLRQ